MIKIIIFLLLYVPLESIAADDEEVKVSIAQYRGGRDAAISYTFDDGLLEQYTLVFPELEKRNIKATFAVNGGWMGCISAKKVCMSCGVPEIGKHHVRAPDLREAGCGHLGGNVFQVLHCDIAERTRPRLAAVFLGIVQPASAAGHHIPCLCICVRQQVIPQQAQLCHRCPALCLCRFCDL